MATRKTSAKTCPHPWRQVRPAIDPRYERCQLCGMVRPAPIPAPWIIAHDEASPAPAPPTLFAGLERE